MPKRSNNRSGNGDPFYEQIDRRKRANDNRRSFSSYKFDLLDALAIDPRLTHSDFHVAYWLAQHINEQTMQCYPSQKLLGEYCHLKEESVRKCIKNLVNAGWLVKKRMGRGTNRYQFVNRNISPMLDQRTMIREGLRLEKFYRDTDPGREIDDRDNNAGDDRDTDPDEHLNGSPSMDSARKKKKENKAILDTSARMEAPVPPPPTGRAKGATEARLSEMIKMSFRPFPEDIQCEEK